MCLVFTQVEGAYQGISTLSESPIHGLHLKNISFTMAKGGRAPWTCQADCTGRGSSCVTGLFATGTVEDVSPPLPRACQFKLPGPPAPPPPPPPPQKVCTLLAVRGCFNDSDATHPILPLSAHGDHDDVTQGNCAALCEAQGMPLAGIDQGNHCKCGKASALAGAGDFILPQKDCQNKEWPCTGACCGLNAHKPCGKGACTGKSAEQCGGVGALLVFNYSCQPQVLAFGAPLLKTDDERSAKEDGGGSAARLWDVAISRRSYIAEPNALLLLRTDTKLGVGDTFVVNAVLPCIRRSWNWTVVPTAASNEHILDMGSMLKFPANLNNDLIIRVNCVEQRRRFQRAFKPNATNTVQVDHGPAGLLVDGQPWAGWGWYIHGWTSFDSPNLPRVNGQTPQNECSELANATTALKTDCVRWGVGNMTDAMVEMAKTGVPAPGNVCVKSPQVATVYAPCL